MTEVRFPGMRAEIVGAVAALADPDYQWSAWIRREIPEGHYDEFTHRIHILYDDTQVLENPDRAIGVYLRSQEEADAMRVLGHAIDLLFAKLGTELSDEEYICAPGWELVVDAARNAQQILMAP